MNWDAIGAIAELVGAIAVVVTLFYLALQVRHSKDATEANTRSLELHSLTAWQSANLELNVAMSNPEQAKIIAAGSFEPRNLSEDSWLTFAMMHVGIFQMAQSTDYLYRAGALDRELWESEMNRVAGILSFPGVRQLRDAGVRRHLTPRFVEQLEATQSTIVAVNWDSERGFYQDES